MQPPLEVKWYFPRQVLVAQGAAYAVADHDPKWDPGLAQRQPQRLFVIWREFVDPHGGKNKVCGLGNADEHPREEDEPGGVRRRQREQEDGQCVQDDGGPNHVLLPHFALEDHPRHRRHCREADVLQPGDQTFFKRRDLELGLNVSKQRRTAPLSKLTMIRSTKRPTKMNERARRDLFVDSLP